MSVKSNSILAQRGSQSMLFDCTMYSYNDAKHWIKEHGFKQSYKGKLGHKEGNYYRFRQSDPVKGAKYITKTLNNYPGVKLIIFVK